MTRPASRYPTELELEILKVLWRLGPCAVRRVRDALAESGRELAYTSVMTIMGIMTKKRYLRREKDGRSYVYSPRIAEGETKQGLLGDIVDRAFDGSARAVMLSLLELGDVDEAELDDLRDLIDRSIEKRGAEQ
ncbi:MAG: BlaI/MecI/CopY family transcriptional regulator [Verrucomicrobia bacterium]|nr:BlaI/MecI/CopY family transcriptional regulator [Verrucomicrobiota bacterium]